MLSVALAYIAWPIYGFVSNQFEVARGPFGWSSIPEPIPQTGHVFDEAYAEAAAVAQDALSLRRQAIGAPAISGAVAINGEIVWTAAIGWSSVEQRLPATPATTFRIGSTSKAVTATALARFVDAGRIDLDRSISNYFGELPNDAWRDLTPRQLVSHTAGLPDYDQNNDWIGLYKSMALGSRVDDVFAALDIVDGSHILFEPGSSFHYSAFGPVLLSAVVQAIAGEPFQAILEREIFDPLGLNAIGPDWDDRFLGTNATFYQRKAGRVKPWRDVDLSLKLAAGGLTATPADLASLGAAWLDDDFISASTREEFWTPVRLPNGQINSQSYALGWRVTAQQIEGVGEVEHYNHGGVSKGAQCWLMVVPKYNLVIAISINSRSNQFADFAGAYFDVLSAFVPAIAQQEK